MKIKYITDTMAVVLRLEKRKLPDSVKDIFLAAENNKISILIPAIVFAEIAYFSEKIELMQLWKKQKNSYKNILLLKKKVSHSILLNMHFRLQIFLNYMTELLLYVQRNLLLF